MCMIFWLLFSLLVLIEEIDGTIAVTLSTQVKVPSAISFGGSSPNTNPKPTSLKLTQSVSGVKMPHLSLATTGESSPIQGHGKFGVTRAVGGNQVGFMETADQPVSKLRPGDYELHTQKFQLSSDRELVNFFNLVTVELVKPKIEMLDSDSRPVKKEKMEKMDPTLFKRQYKFHDVKVSSTECRVNILGQQVYNGHVYIRINKDEPVDMSLSMKFDPNADGPNPFLMTKSKFHAPATFTVDFKSNNNNGVVKVETENDACPAETTMTFQENGDNTIVDVQLDDSPSKQENPSENGNPPKSGFKIQQKMAMALPPGVVENIARGTIALVWTFKSDLKKAQSVYDFIYNLKKDIVEGQH